MYLRQFTTQQHNGKRTEPAGLMNGAVFTLGASNTIPHVSNRVKILIWQIYR